MTVLGVGLDQRTVWTRYVSARRVGHRILVAGILLAWLAWAVLMWWGSARPADGSTARADATAGRVTSYERSSGFHEPSFWVTPNLPVADPHGQRLVWTTADGRMHVASLGPFHQSGGELLTGGRVSGSLQPADRALLQRLRATGAPSTVHAPWALRSGWLIGVLALGMAAVVLVNNRRPGFGTRWYWFWVGLLPLGAGLLAWTLIERLPLALGNEPPVRSRGPSRGWRGLGWLLLGSLFLQVVVWVLRSHLGAWLVPA